MIITIDEGTSSTRALLIDQNGQILKTSQQEFKQIYPQSSWVEHDPIEIYQKTLECVKAVMNESVTGIAITNQRETTIIWDKNTGKPIYNAIVWQCKRSANICKALKSQQQFSDYIYKTTGLIIDSYFSASKIMWLIDNIVKPKKLNIEDLIFGTIDTWLIWNLTKGASHLTDTSNASRTMLYDIHQNQWDDLILETLAIPKSLLPKVIDSNANFGEAEINGKKIPILAVLGDQQAAYYAYGAKAKATYGTGTFLLLPNSGIINKGLLVSNAHSKSGISQLCNEGSIFVGGSLIQWLKDEMKFIKSSSEIEALANSVKDSGGVYLIPALAGLGAPYWNENARGSIFGITRATSQANIARAALESLAFRVRDIFEALDDESRKTISELNVDGGASRNDTLMQFQADLLQIPIKRHKDTEMTALGAALMTGHVNLELSVDKVFEPKQNLDHRYQEWKKYLSLLIGN
ncbi:MAG: glycerol kinase GlpK [Candidatus Caenarcaniphilales bacterium]|nr:glycerol kinase GlpK [Candidatus Caenarcaniphilales bacterium]